MMKKAVTLRSKKSLTNVELHVFTTLRPARAGIVFGRPILLSCKWLIYKDIFIFGLSGDFA